MRLESEISDPQDFRNNRKNRHFLILENYFPLNLNIPYVPQYSVSEALIPTIRELRLRWMQSANKRWELRGSRATSRAKQAHRNKMTQTQSQLHCFQGTRRAAWRSLPMGQNLLHPQALTFLLMVSESSYDLSFARWRPLNASRVRNF